MCGWIAPYPCGDVPYPQKLRCCVRTHHLRSLTVYIAIIRYMSGPACMHNALCGRRAVYGDDERVENNILITFRLAYEFQMRCICSRSIGRLCITLRIATTEWEGTRISYDPYLSKRSRPLCVSDYQCRNIVPGVMIVMQIHRSSDSTVRQAIV